MILHEQWDLQFKKLLRLTFRSYTIPGAGTEPALIAAASVSKQGIVSGPVKGNNGVLYANCK